MASLQAPGGLVMAHPTRTRTVLALVVDSCREAYCAEAYCAEEGSMWRDSCRVLILMIAVLSCVCTGAEAQNAPEGQLTIAFDTTIAPSYLDPAEVAGLATPFTFLYALHDAMIKPLPGNNMAPCLAESWTESADGLVYEFKLRAGLKFHNGDAFTAEDVKFTFERYKGASAKLL